MSSNYHFFGYMNEIIELAFPIKYNIFRVIFKLAFLL
jgi:hypothetical protein